MFDPCFRVYQSPILDIVARSLLATRSGWNIVHRIRCHSEQFCNLTTMRRVSRVRKWRTWTDHPAIVWLHKRPTPMASWKRSSTREMSFQRSAAELKWSLTMLNVWSKSRLGSRNANERAQMKKKEEHQERPTRVGMWTLSTVAAQLVLKDIRPRNIVLKYGTVFLALIFFFVF